MDSNDGDAHNISSSGEERKDVYNVTYNSSEDVGARQVDDVKPLDIYEALQKIAWSLARRQCLEAVSVLKYVFGYGTHLRLLEELFRLCSKQYSVDLDKSGLPEAVSSVMHLLVGAKKTSYMYIMLYHFGRVMCHPYPRSNVLHAVLNFKGLDKDMIQMQLIPRRENFLCSLLNRIPDGYSPRLSFERSRTFALLVEAAGPPLHYGPPLPYRPPLYYGPPQHSIEQIHSRNLLLTPSWTQRQPLFKTAVKLNLYEEALLLYRTGAVCYKELHQIQKEEESKEHWSWYRFNQDPQTHLGLAEFLDSVIHTPRSLFLTCTLEVASLITRRPERAEALRGRLPQLLIDVVMFKPLLENFEDAIMKRCSCTHVEKIFTT